MEEKKLPFTGREKIRFNVPPFTGREYEYVRQAVENQKICGDGEFTKKASHWFEEKTGTAKCLMTTSCTHATELAAILADIKPGDEIIMPSYTFVSTANAFVLRGGVPVFVDIRPDTMNIDEKQIEAAITEKTKAIVPVHYAGVACEMDTIMDIAKRHNLLVIEDAAQGVMASYKGKALGSIGDYGCYSFHETKNYSMGEGGALLIRDHERQELINYLKERDILAVYHYVPLHSAPAGIKYGRFNGEDVYTTKESERLLRLPMYYGLTAEETAFVADQVKKFYGR